MADSRVPRHVVPRALEGRLREQLADIGAMLGHPVAQAPVEYDAAIALVDDLRDRLLGRLREQPDRWARRLAAPLADVLELREQLRDAFFVERHVAYGRVHDAIERLRVIEDAALLVDAICAEASASCGFDRVLLSRISAEEWTPQCAYFAGAQADAHAFLREVSAMVLPLRPGSREATMVEFQRPLLVRSTRDEAPEDSTLVAIAGSISYAAAPIRSAGRVIGLLHADHHAQGYLVDTLDRDALWLFAEALGPLVDCVVLRERLRSHSSEVRARLRHIDRMLDELAVARVDIARAPDAADDAGHDQVRAGRPGAGEGVELSRRELEVLELMATGASNSVIAGELYLATATVKGHVGSILRKLGAANRAEAVSWHLHDVLRTGGDRASRAVPTGGANTPSVGWTAVSGRP